MVNREDLLHGKPVLDFMVQNMLNMRNYASIVVVLFLNGLGSLK